MMRHLAVPAAACFVLISPLSPFAISPQQLPLSEVQLGSIRGFLKGFLILWLFHEVNAALSRWAENRWMWKHDTSVWRWQDEVAVVTGGSKGIGASIVQELVARQIKVAVLDIEPLSDDLANNKLVRWYSCDVTSRDAVHEAGEAIRADLGSPSILINNAGVGNASTILELSPGRLDKIFKVNIQSHWNTVQEFLPGMVAVEKGHIMSTASLSAFLGIAGMVDYCCTKAALIAFHEGLTQEIKHRYHCPQIKTTIVYPNWTRTRMTDAIAEGIKSVGHPIVEPKEVAEAMVKQIIARKSGQLIVGPSLAVYIRVLPMWLQELIRDRVAKVISINASTAEA